MGQELKSFWKKLRRGFRAWLILAAAAFLTFAITDKFAGNLNDWDDWLPALVLAFGASLIISAALVALWIFARWLCCWRNFKRFLFGVACLAVLVALFYAEEDWRGWHAWNKFKQEWEAKGEKFDWQSVVPPPVPDDQNFAMAPIFDTTDKLLDGELHEPPDGTSILNRLDMSVYGRLDGYFDEETNTTGNWAKGTFTDLKPWQTYYRAPARTNEYLGITTNVYPVSPQPQSPAADVLLALSKYGSAIEELRQASLRPYSRFPVAYEQENQSEIFFLIWRD